MSVISHHLGGNAVRIHGTRFPLNFSTLLTLATILLYALTIGVVVVAAVNDPGGGLADTFLGR